MSSRKRSSNEDEEIGLNLMSTDEEDSEKEAQFLEYGHFFSEDKRGKKWKLCTKFWERCLGECTGHVEAWTDFIFSDFLNK
jgi:hypothetical protein